MSNIFNKIQLTNPPRSTFDLSYDHKLSLKMGKLVPVHVQECVPGDYFHMSSEALLRMMPLVAPIMDVLEVTIHHFFCPNRINWPQWELFITGGEDGTAIPPALPLIADAGNTLNVAVSDLSDYLGLPLGNIGAEISALPFAAYQRIWHEYYRDQNISTGAMPQLQDGIQDPGVISSFTLLRDRAWGHDYFTSALPWTQKGGAVSLPMDITGTAPVNLNPTGDPWRLVQKDGSDFSPTGGYDAVSNFGGNLDASGASGDSEAVFDPNGTLEADFSQANISNTTTINDLRSSYALQKWLEKNARAGSRYFESNMAHFRVKTPDARLQRPEYLGGMKARMTISEVLQQSESATTPQGTMAGHGISASGGRDFKYRCVEHGYIIGIMSIKPRTSYYQGIPRHFFKNDRLMYAWPDFARLGEQPVLNKEIYFSNNDPVDEQTFGYMPRYAEYRFNNGRVSGQMRTTLEFWHMGRKFASLPTLNSDFIYADPTKRIFAVTDPEEDEIVAHVFHRIRASRPLPKYGSPGGL